MNTNSSGQKGCSHRLQRAVLEKRNLPGLPPRAESVQGPRAEGWFADASARRWFEKFVKLDIITVDSGI